MPNESEQKQLWRVLSEQNGIQMSDEQIDQIVKTLSNISGRDIKNLLKLAMVAAENVRGVVTPELVKMVSKFKQSGTTGSGRTSGLIPDRKTRPISRDEKEWE
jgi:AAA+ superfamily predicted ATPase